MNTSKLTAVTRDILSYITSENLQKGARLLSERNLAEFFKTSRNTVREALQLLQERCIIDIKRGSGCYVTGNIEVTDTGNNSDSGSNEEIIQNQLEARFLFEPLVAELAMERIGKEKIEKLEQSIIGLSQAIMKKDYSDIIAHDNLFRRILAQSTGNAVLAMSVRQLEMNTHHTWKMMSRLPEEALNMVFANYVKALNAIQARDIPRVKAHIKNIILTICKLFSKYSHLDFSGILSKKQQNGGSLV